MAFVNVLFPPERELWGFLLSKVSCTCSRRAVYGV